MFGRTFVLFRLLGFRVQADPSWLFLALLVSDPVTCWLLNAGIKERV